MPVRHLLYGLCLSSNEPIPSLPLCNQSLATEIEIHLKEKSGREPFSSRLPPDFFYLSPNLGNNGKPIARVGMLGGSYYGFFYGDGAKFAVRQDGREIWADGPEKYTLEDLATYLVGPVMGFVLRLLGSLPLHACAVVAENKAIALVGSQGAGKSTTAATFAKLGYAILSEDVTAVTEVGENFLIQPGYPRVNLWPESAETVFGSLHSLPITTPAWGKHFLPLDDARHRFQRDALELGAIFLLRERAAPPSKVRIERISPASAMRALITNTYVNYLLDAEMRRREFVQLGQLLRKTPVYDVWPTDDPTQVNELCESISAQARDGNRCIVVS